jgi:hypothetical protein
MKFIPAIILITCQLAHGEAINPDLPVLLDKISTTCGDRWIIDIDDSNRIILSSKDKTLGKAEGYQFSGFEEEYTLYFRFKIVDPIDTKAAEQAKDELKKLREQGDKIEQRNIMGHYNYYPKNTEQWSLVLSIKRAERIVEDIPELRFKSVYLSVEYTMGFFVPNKDNYKAVIYKNDINNLYKLFERVGS